MRLRELKLRTGIDSPERGPNKTMLDSRVQDRFVASEALQLEDLGHCVRISGPYGVQRQPWSNVAEAWELEAPPSTGTAQAAAAKPRGAK
jgi:hypothetical protein